MAFTTKFNSYYDPTVLRTAYNIDWSVGRGGSNGREDVMLVQALFRIWFWETMQVGDDIMPVPPGETEVIKVDGWWGPSTQRYIDHFKQEAIKRGADITSDVVMDPFRETTWAKSRISKTDYALGVLVGKCARNCEANGETFYVNLPNRQDVPLQLRNALKMVKSTANQYRYG